MQLPSQKKLLSFSMIMLYNNSVMKFYAIEGTDGSGKKTQIKKLYDYLKSKGADVHIVSFPDYDSPSSAPIKMYLSGEFGDNPNVLDAYQASTLFATDRICTMTKLLPQLKSDAIVLFDRYVQSNLLHQAGKIQGRKERENFARWLDDFEFNILKLPRTDKVIFLDLPASKAMELISKRGQLKIGDEYEKDIHEANYNHLSNAYNAGLEACELFGWSKIQCLDDFGEILTPDEIHEKIKAALEI